MIRPTPYAVYLALGGVPVALAATLIDAALWPMWLIYTAAVLLALAVDVLASPPNGRLQVAVTAPDTMFIGDSGQLAVRIAVVGYKGTTELDVLCDLGAELEPQPMQTAVTTGGEPATARVELRPIRRGRLAIERVWIRWRGPLNLVSRHHRHDIDRTLDVVPNLGAVRRTAIRFFARDAPTGIKVDDHPGDGSEYEALREFIPGMDRRWIDWKQSARHHKLVCKEFRAERNHSIVVAVDTGRLMADPLEGIPKLDWAINASLNLAYVSSRAGDRIGLFGFDSRPRAYSAPASGRSGFRRIQQLTAQLAYSREETNFTLGMAELAGKLRRRSLIVLLTDFTDSAMAELMVVSAGRLVHKHLVLFASLRSPEVDGLITAEPAAVEDVARSVVARDLLRDREVVLERLRRRGVHCLDAVPAAVNADLVNAYLRIKRRELI